MLDSSDCRFIFNILSRYTSWASSGMAGPLRLAGQRVEGSYFNLLSTTSQLMISHTAEMWSARRFW